MKTLFITGLGFMILGIIIVCFGMIYATYNLSVGINSPKYITACYIIYCAGISGIVGLSLLLIHNIRYNEELVQEPSKRVKEEKPDTSFPLPVAPFRQGDRVEWASKSIFTISKGDKGTIQRVKATAEPNCFPSGWAVAVHLDQQEPSGIFGWADAGDFKLI